MKTEVRCSPAADGYTCAVQVGDGTSATRHTVRVRRRDMDRWARGRSVDQLVRHSFEFLLDREPAGSILREFELSVIEQYFPEFSRVIVESDPGEQSNDH
jgi:hypothetical protein